MAAAALSVFGSLISSTLSWLDSISARYSRWSWAGLMMFETRTSSGSFGGGGGFAFATGPGKGPFFFAGVSLEAFEGLADDDPEEPLEEDDVSLKGLDIVPDEIQERWR